MTEGIPNVRILLAAPTQGVYGGIEAVVLALARHLRETAHIEPRVVFKLVSGHRLGDDLRGRANEAAVPVEFVERASGALWRATAWADLIHAHNLSPDIILSGSLRGCPVVATVYHHRPAAPSLRRWLWGRMLKVPRRVWFISRSVADSWGGLGDPRRAIRFQVSDLDLRFAPFEFRRGFVFVARWIANKGADTLIEAYSQARIDKERHPLHMMGDGPLLPVWRENVRRRELTGITLHGFVGEAEKRRRLAEARWLVVPPHTNEDMGLTPIESRSLGVPCVATRDGGLPEVAGSDAILCEPGSVDALQAALEQAASLPEAAYRERSRSTFRELNGQIGSLNAYVEAYRGVLRR